MEWVELGEILSIEKGKKPEKQSAEQKKGYLPYVNIEVFETGKISTFTDGNKCVPCEEGDILIVCDGARSGLIGLAKKGYVGSTLAKLTANNLERKFLFYFLQSKFALLNTRTKGSGTPHLNTDLLKRQKIILLDKKEQMNIIEQIEKQYSKLEAGIEGLQKVKQQLAVYRQAVLNEAFRGDYQLKPLSEISKIISGYAFKSKLYESNGSYIIIKIGNVKQFTFDFSRDLTRTNEASEIIQGKYLLKSGDCLITLTGSRGKRDYGYVAMIKEQENYLLNQRVAALRFNQTMAVPEFYQYYLSSDEYRNKFFSYETGNVGQGNVGVKALLEPLVKVPSLEQQNKIAKDIEHRLFVCGNIEKAVAIALQQSESMRQSILRNAFEGDFKHE